MDYDIEAIFNMCLTVVVMYCSEVSERLYFALVIWCLSVWL